MKRGLCGREPTACKSEVKEVNETRNGGRVFVHFVHFSLYAAVALFSSFPCQRLCVFSCGLIRASITFILIQIKQTLFPFRSLISYLGLTVH